MRPNWFFPLVLLLPVPSFANAPVGPGGAQLQIEREDALVIWNPATKTEDLIIRLRLATQAKRFGLLVPVPKDAQVEVIPGDFFDRLDSVVAPHEVVLEGWNIEPTAAILLLLESAEPPSVLDRIPPAGDHVTATGRAEMLTYAELGPWLEAARFGDGRGLREWGAPYDAQGFVLAAFSLEAAGDHVTTPALRLRFQTERPFYPYREPSIHTRNTDTRALHLYLLTRHAHDGAIGPRVIPWVKTTLYRQPQPDYVNLLGSDAPAVLIDDPWLHGWLDDITPRVADEDIFFPEIPHGSALRLDPEVIDRRTHIPIPLDVLALILFASYGAYRRKRMMPHDPEG